MLLAFLFLLHRVASMPRLPLQEAAEKTLCPFKYRKDILETRVPRLIHKVECLGKAESLQEVTYVDTSGHFNRSCTCTEIYSSLLVTYLHPSGRHTTELTYPIGCACVNPTSQPLRRIFPDIVHR